METGGRFAELRRHFDITAESLRHDIGLVAENVIRVEEKLEQEAASIRSAMNERFDETHALIRFSPVITAMAETDVALASAGDPLGRKPPAEAGATSISARIADV